MTGTRRAVAVPGKRVHDALEAPRWRQERQERIVRTAKDAKRIARAEAHTERRELRRRPDATALVAEFEG